MSENSLDALNHELAGLLARVSPAERKKLSRAIVRDLRKSQIARIRERRLKNWQQNKRLITGTDIDKNAQRSFRKGDIQRFTAIKKDRIKVKGKSKQTRMFKRLATVRYMRVFSNENEAAIFFAPAAANIAAVHQFGQKERLRNLDIQYPQRELLGFSPDDARRIEAAIIDFLAS